MNKETTWISVRLFSPTDEYRLPRWHADGIYYDFVGKQEKFVATLKGPSTLFFDLNEEDKKYLYSTYLSLQPDWSKINEVLAESFKDRDQIRTEPNHGMLYRVGDESALVDSEPNIDIERIFFSVLPGSIKEIDKLRVRWKNQF